MNTDTGQIYRGEGILAARLRGEPVVEVSEKVAQTMEAGQRVMNRAERRRQERENRRANKVR